MYKWNTLNVKNYRWEKEYNLKKEQELFVAVQPPTYQMGKSDWRKYFGEQRKLIAYQKNFQIWQGDSSSKRKWLAKTSLCPKCSREVSNREYWGQGKKPSIHFKGTCKPKPFFLTKIPLQSWKSPITYPTGKGWEPIITTVEQLQAYWNGSYNGRNWKEAEDEAA